MSPITLLSLMCHLQQKQRLYLPSASLDGQRWKDPYQLNPGMPILSFLRKDPLHIKPNFLVNGGFLSGPPKRSDSYIPIVFRNGHKYLIKILHRDLPAVVDLHNEGCSISNLQCTADGRAIEFYAWLSVRNGNYYRHFFWRVGMREAVPVSSLKFYFLPETAFTHSKYAFRLSPGGHYVWKASIRKSALCISYLNTNNMKWHFFAPQHSKFPFRLSSNFFELYHKEMFILAGYCWYKTHYGGKWLVKIQGAAPYAFLPKQNIKVYRRKAKYTTTLHIVDDNTGTQKVLVFSNNQSLVDFPVADVFMDGKALEVMAAGQMRLLSIPKLSEINVPPQSLLAFQQFVIWCYSSDNIPFTFHSRRRTAHHYYSKVYRFRENTYWPAGLGPWAIGTPDGVLQILGSPVSAIFPADSRSPCVDDGS